MGRKDGAFEQALKDKNIPVLTLDHKWHMLFNNADATTAILKLEEKIEDHKRLISDCNDKMEQYKEELMELPAQIAEVNYDLMLATMDACYDVLNENTREIEEIGRWISDVRVELKKKIIRKQEKEQKNHELYTYMHAIFGADVINLFDMKYDPETRHPRKADKKPEEEETD